MGDRVAGASLARAALFCIAADRLAAAEFLLPLAEFCVPALSRDVIHWSATDAKSMSMLQVVWQTQPGSPSKAIMTVPFIKVDIVVARVPRKVRNAILRSRMLALVLGIFLNEYKLRSETKKSEVRYVLIIMSKMRRGIEAIFCIPIQQRPLGSTLAMR